MHRAWWSTLLLLATYLPLSAQTPGELAVEVPAKFDFVAYGDIRFTNPLDRVVSNPHARREIVQHIAEANPSFLLVTGDLVLAGEHANDWKIWHTETTALREVGIPIFPVLGNHDLRGDPRAVHYFAQFPALQQRRWYTVRAGNVLCFMLDSASDAPGGEQWNWLVKQLDQVPADVDFLVFALHHPPYTKSANHMLGGGHAARPAEEQLADMLEQRQQAMRPRMIVLAGHVHNYERYQYGGVMYVVTGGGGATPYSVTRSPEDYYHESGPTYHFVRFSVDGRKLRAEMNKLTWKSGKPEWAVKDSFELEAPKVAKAAR